MVKIIEDEALHNRTHVFADRSDAGRQLAVLIKEHVDDGSLVLTIPSGGVPVGLEIGKALYLEIDLILVRKVQIPWNTEAGFGAVNMDGELFLNDHLLSMLNLTDDQIERQVRTTLATIEQRNLKFRQSRPFPEIASRHIILVDDGLASGYTMRAAIAYIKKRAPGSITMAVSTGSADTVMALAEEVDTLCCLNIRESYPYAVAAAYRNWYDLEDDDVLTLLKRG